jgi:hypothetical protein
MTFARLRTRLAAREEARQIAAGDPYADLEEVYGLEQRRGIRFKDGARIVGPFQAGSADPSLRTGPTGWEIFG